MYFLLCPTNQQTIWKVTWHKKYREILLTYYIWWCFRVLWLKAVSWAVAAHAWIKFFLWKLGQNYSFISRARVGMRVHGLFFSCNFTMKINFSKRRGGGNWTPTPTPSVNPLYNDVHTKTNLVLATAEGEGTKLICLF